MRKPLFLLVILIFMAFNAYAAGIYDFRGITWGMTLDEVKNIETGTLIGENQAEDEDLFLVFDVLEPIFGLKAQTVYWFANEDGQDICYGQLNGCSYNLKVDLEKDKYSDKYLEIKQILTKEFGDAQSTEHYFHQKTLDDFESLEDAILQRGVFLMTIWELENYTKILDIHKSSGTLIISIADIYNI